MIDVDTHAHLAEQLEHEVDSVWLGSNPVGARFACKMQQGHVREAVPVVDAGAFVR